MDNVVSINHTKENTLEFDITSEGVETKDISVRLVVKAKGMDLSFEAKKKEKDTWMVKLPKLPMLDKTTYNMKIEVVADGYYFEPLKGKLNVVGSAELYSTEPKNVTLSPDDKKGTTKEKKEVKEHRTPSSPYTKNSEKPIEQIARELMEKHNFTPAEVDRKIEQVKEKAEGVDTSKNEKVIAILEEIGIKPKAKAKRSFSLKTRLLDS